VTVPHCRMFVRREGAHLLKAFASNVEFGVVPGVPSAISLFAVLRCFSNFGSDYMRCTDYCAYALGGVIIKEGKRGKTIYFAAEAP
jgi:hypothetical protein